MPGPLAGLGEAALNRRAVRDLALPRDVAPGLARHCAEEYGRLAEILPELHSREAVAR